MSEPLVEPDDRTEEETATVFRQVMASITEQACATGREGDVMAALFPLFLDNVGDNDGEDLGL